MTRTPVQMSPETRDSLQSDQRRYNLDTLEAVINFHRTRSYAYERVQGKMRLKGKRLRNATIHIEDKP